MTRLRSTDSARRFFESPRTQCPNSHHPSPIRKILLSLSEWSYRNNNSMDSMLPKVNSSLSSSSSCKYYYYYYLLFIFILVVMMSSRILPTLAVHASSPSITQDLASNPYSKFQLLNDQQEESSSVDISTKFMRALSKQKEFHLSGKRRNAVTNMANGGEQPFELFPIAGRNQPIAVKADIEYRFLGMDFGGQYVNGHLIILKNPIQHFSFLEPGPPPKVESSKKSENTSSISKIVNAYQQSNRDMRGGCYYNVTATVVETAKNNLNNHFCLYATNAGFFNTHVHSCLGNVISDGRIVHSSKRHNVNFGITKDGEYFVGYLNENTDLTKFDQLMAGVIWLVRKGQSFVTESEMIEEMTTQETGPSFVTVRASRSAIGHNKDGHLVLISIDGDGNHSKGPTLHELALLLIELGVENAINLDGGGSVTVVRDNNIIINSVSDGCHASADNDYDADFGKRNSYFRCPRNVMTTTCFHDYLSETERAIQKALVGQDQEQFSSRINQFIFLMQILIALVLIIGFSVIILLIVFTCSLCCCGGIGGSRSDTHGVKKPRKGPKYAKLNENDLEMMNMSIDEDDQSENGDVLQSVDKEFMETQSPQTTTK
ncbi:hypothetical protein FDP41_003377 [Naegleria fowleri]|uniref:Phosphodiester glycosidase domain-containing protein n=1 Tax=Naegleria fowleri TaxID=5763 RepID=A0A6A5BVK8_NAEFO|nr:uncharacterized protein FDP41_003377 [Naegleria fowleri]KAF0977385.1 hypothetical protein FDP41_003377 [Naegleria fowleri]